MDGMCANAFSVPANVKVLTVLPQCGNMGTETKGPSPIKALRSMSIQRVGFLLFFLFSLFPYILRFISPCLTKQIDQKVSHKAMKPVSSTLRIPLLQILQNKRQYLHSDLISLRALAGSGASDAEIQIVREFIQPCHNRVNIFRSPSGKHGLVKKASLL
jgi:hypothetical protein